MFFRYKLNKFVPLDCELYELGRANKKQIHTLCAYVHEQSRRENVYLRERLENILEEIGIRIE